MNANSKPLTRRALLGSVLAAAACGRKRGSRYQGWLLVASGSERGVAIANLAQFRRVITVPLPHAPDQLFFAGNRIFVTCKEGAEMVEIDPAGFRVANRIALPGKPMTARILPGNASGLVVTSDPPALVVVDLARGRVSGRVSLPAAPADADFGEGMAAVTLPSRNSVLRASAPGFRVAGETDLGVSGGVIRFRKDGKTILAAAPDARQIITLDAQSGALLARLTLPISPSRFCFNPDGGQMFVTGAGEDAVVIVNPYQNEVDQTILAGRMPGSMAVSERQNLLFVTNRERGDLTILDIDTRLLCATVHLGGSPSEVLVTPDSEYALVVDGRSGNVSVLHISSVPRPDVARRVVIPIFTDFPTASEAQSALIVPFQS